MKLRKFIYASNGGGVDQADEAVMIPVDSVTGIELANNAGNQGSHIVLTAKEMHNQHTINVSEIFFECETGRIKEALDQVVSALNSNPKDGFIVFDKDTPEFMATGRNYIKGISIDTDN
tara:strand:+ start:494 stop:850 length:357 start_codon:yes stop_codon:yes gene_type:complete